MSLGTCTNAIYVGDQTNAVVAAAGVAVVVVVVVVVVAAVAVVVATGVTIG